MKTLNEKTLYSEIQKKLFSIIPEKWESIYLYASIIEMPNKRVTGEMYFYYFPKGIIKKKPVNCYEIPGAFNIDEAKYSDLITELYNIIKNLRQIYVKNHKKKWSNITISIENFKFKVEYDFQNLNKSLFDSYERHIIWRYNYLKTDIKSFDRKDKKIISRYLDMIDQLKIPKRDVYIEGIYSNPVKNIVDYEKTLSVEEALAQSDDNYEKKEKVKHHLFNKKKKIEDIIEYDEDDDSEFGNNQILNWKK